MNNDNDSTHYADAEKIKKLINQKFPKPVINSQTAKNLPEPMDIAVHHKSIEPSADSRVPEGFDACIEIGSTAEHIEARKFEYFAYRAVNVNSRKNRDFMMSEVRDLLFNGEHLPMAARAWLIYVLIHCDGRPIIREIVNLLLNTALLPINSRALLYRSLGSLKDIPHETKGRPIASQSEFKEALLDFLNETGVPIPRGQVVARLKMAAERMPASYEKIRRIYYSKGFQERLLNTSSGRMCWSLEEFLNWDD